MSRSIGLLLLVRSLLATFFGSPTLLNSGPIAFVATVLAGGLTACGGKRDVAVRVSIPNPDSLETPAASVAIVALPYDRDSVLASLQARARTPKPATAALDSLFARFRGPFTTYTALSYATSELRDSLALLQEQLELLARGTSQHRLVSTRVTHLSDSLAAVESRRDRARTVLDRARISFVSRSESLRAAVRQWEDSTYRGYDSIVRNLTLASGREAITDTTGQTGWANFSLSPGPWWLYARAWDTSDPNSEWYWNVPVDDDTMLLSSRTGRRRPRY